MRNPRANTFTSPVHSSLVDEPMYHFAPLVAAGAAAATDPNATKKVVDTLKDAAAAIGIGGGADQDRFIDRTLEVDKAFDDAGYNQQKSPGYVSYPPGYLFTKYKIRKTQVDDKRANYQEDFDRLHGYIRERMNNYNPGLGDYWASIQPSLPLVTKGNISKQSLQSFKDLVNQYPPGTYRAGADPFAELAAMVNPGQSPVAGGAGVMPAADEKKNRTIIAVAVAVVGAIVLTVVGVLLFRS